MSLATSPEDGPSVGPHLPPWHPLAEPVTVAIGAERVDKEDADRWSR